MLLGARGLWRIPKSLPTWAGNPVLVIREKPLCISRHQVMEWDRVKNLFMELLLTNFLKFYCNSASVIISI